MDRKQTLDVLKELSFAKDIVKVLPICTHTRRLGGAVEGIWACDQ